MTNSMKGVNTAVAIVKKVAKQSTKVLAVALPPATILLNAIEANNANLGNPELALNDFISRYTGVDRWTGQFKGERFMLGTGRLLIAGLTGWAISQFA